ncbi:MAG: nucleotidyltransferase domain-containing protein [Cyanobacteria bacterium J06598_3]
MQPETKTIGFQPCETAIPLPKDAIADFCDRWKINEFYLFGSILRHDFHADSDVDVMVKFFPNPGWGFEIVDMKEELEALFKRKVDFMTKASIEQSHNQIRRREILGTARLIYVSG